MDEEPRENTMSVEQLRKELRFCWDLEYALLRALRRGEIPSPHVLKFLGEAAKYPEDYTRGKELQQQLGFDIIPPVTECEMGAGLWSRLNVTAPAQPAATPDKPV